MRILLTNDDGIHAPGLASLERIASQLSNDVWVVAPESDQSGLAHSLTLNQPLRLRRVDDRRFALTGTPTDCVIMAVRQLLDSPPDLILSGMNSGQNAGDDVTYSGTVAGAMEGAMLGIRSIALSQAYTFANGEREIPWRTGEAHAPALIDRFSAIGFPAKTLVNINFPNCEPDAVRGVRVTVQGAYTHGLFMEERRDGRGFPYYWLRFGREVPEQREGSDIQAIRDNWISVTPLKLDLTDDKFGAELSKML